MSACPPGCHVNFITFYKQRYILHARKISYFKGFHNCSCCSSSVCEKSSFHTHEKRLNEFMMKSKLKRKSFAVGGGVGIQINERGSKNTGTM